jgi:phosphate transport system substrate-binding protein
LPLALGLVLALAAGDGSQDVDLPSYHPPPGLAGAIRIWGDPHMGGVLKNWQDGFRRHHPEVQFEATLKGTDTAMAGLYTGVADLALMGREADTTETMGFAWVLKHPPLGIEASTGSLDAPDKSFAPVLFVHRDNPVSRLTLAQLDAVFGCERRRGPKPEARRWGQLGLLGEWADKPIHPYGPPLDSDVAEFFGRVVLLGSLKWNCDLTEGGLSLEALADDPTGIAVSSLRYASARVKPLALAAEDGAAYVAPTRETVAARTYPLARSTTVYVDRTPGKPLEPRVEHFLRYVLSGEGQCDVAREGDYLPLPPEVARQQLQKLDETDALPSYRPEQKVSGIIRNFGNGFAGVLAQWEEGFRRFQPDISFRDTLPTSDAALPALITGVTDLAPSGAEPALTETLAFFEIHGYHPTAVTVASGTFDVDGHSAGIVVFVHQDNPLTRLTLKQLDGIFGAERSGGLRGFKWTLEDARGAADDIRTWGQLGLVGRWADKPIHTYGHAPSGASRFFQLRVLRSSEKWNSNYRGYVETGSKMISDTDTEQRGGIKHMLAEELARDPYGIAWTIVPQARGIAGIKAVALAAREDGPYVEPSRESFRKRTYPLVRSIYIYLDRRPGAAVEPRLREFLRYILSREGQEIVARDGGFLPLPADVVREELRKLD